MEHLIAEAVVEIIIEQGAVDVRVLRDKCNAQRIYYKD